MSEERDRRFDRALAEACGAPPIEPDARNRQALEDACRDPSGWLMPSGLAEEMAAGMPRRMRSPDSLAAEAVGRRERLSRAIQFQAARLGSVCRGGHFVYASRKHGPDYVSKDTLFTELQVVRLIAEAMTDLVPCETEVLIAPAVAGVFLVNPVAERIASRDGLRVPYMTWAEKDGGGFRIRDPHKRIVAGRGVTILEDVITTAGSVEKVEDAVIAAGGRVLRIVGIWNRGKERATRRQTAIDCAVEEELPMYDVEHGEACPLCEAGVPVNTDFGHGAEFLAKKAAEG